MAEGDFKQQTQFPTREAPFGGAQAAAVSDDNKASMAATEALRAAARQRIAETRHDTIGSAP